MTEQLQLHLLPHIEASSRQHQQFAVARAWTNGSQAYVLGLEWHGTTDDLGQVRAAAFALSDRFPEGATYVRQRWVSTDGTGIAMTLRSQVGTGELASEAGSSPMATLSQ